jgi:hypothetical protein
MNLEELASIGEFIGGFAVLLTLVYLAIEVRNNTKTLKAEANNTTYIDWSEFNAMMSQHPHREVISRAFNPQESFENFEPADQFTIACLARTMIQKFSAAHFQHKAGMLGVENWTSYMTYCKSVFSLPVFSAWWKEERQQPIYSPEFIAAIEAASVENVYFGDGSNDKGARGM